jgi:REP element-mobilizing transposase RayT
MVLGHHIIIGVHGFWLPNDPRGSWSDFVGRYELRRYGPATKTTERRSLAYKEHDHRLRLAAKTAMKYPAVEFTGLQARAVGIGFGNYVRKSGMIVWACAILPDHIHLVTCRHRLIAERLVIQLKGSATEQLIAEGIHPYQNIRDDQGRVPKCFARGEWKVYLETVEDIVRAIEYVGNNPIKEGKPRQKWPFVTTFDPRALGFGLI